MTGVGNDPGHDRQHPAEPVGGGYPTHDPDSPFDVAIAGEPAPTCSNHATRSSRHSTGSRISAFSRNPSTNVRNASGRITGTWKIIAPSGPASVSTSGPSWRAAEATCDSSTRSLATISLPPISHGRRGPLVDDRGRSDVTGSPVRTTSPSIRSSRKLRWVVAGVIVAGQIPATAMKVESPGVDRAQNLVVGERDGFPCRYGLKDRYQRRISGQIGDHPLHQAVVARAVERCQLGAGGDHAAELPQRLPIIETVKPNRQRGQVERGEFLGVKPRIREIVLRRIRCGIRRLADLVAVTFSTVSGIPITRKSSLSRSNARWNAEPAGGYPSTRARICSAVSGRVVLRSTAVRFSSRSSLLTDIVQTTLPAWTPGIGLHRPAEESRAYRLSISLATRSSSRLERVFAQHGSLSLIRLA